MIWRTHIIGGVQAGVLMAAASGADPKLALMEIGAAALGSIMPDIDQPNSKISRSDIVLKGASQALSKVTKHRREVHTVWASFLFGLLTAIVLCLASVVSATGTSFFMGLLVALIIDARRGKIGIPIGMIVFFAMPYFINTEAFVLDKRYILPCSIAVFLGCISHLIYDSANKEGIMWLHPFSKKRYRFLSITTQSKEEDYFFFGMLLITMLMIVVLKPFGSEYVGEIFHSLSTRGFVWN